MHRYIQYVSFVLMLILNFISNVNAACVQGFYEPDCEPCVHEACICTTNSHNCPYCFDGYFKNGPTGLCIKCPENCNTCLNATSCQTCKVGFKGNTCEIAFNCSSKNCKCKTSGSCDSCDDGYFGIDNNCIDVCISNCTSCSSASSCTDCKQKKYGRVCELQCSVGCNGGSCNKTDGSCNCSSNFNGTKCDQCIRGRYGQSCEMICANGCLGSCHYIDGTCPCASNFTGSKCDLCLPGRYGTTCEMMCSHGCSNESCSSIEGTCNCSEHFAGSKCEQCKPGRYGASCELNCSRGCDGGSCEKVDGNCDCTINFTGVNCDQCSIGRYGVSCEMNCSEGCSGGSCNKNDGTCGCKDNFIASKCDQCAVGRYGKSCETICSQHCAGGSCNKLDGTCKCSDNYTGIKCDQCASGKYGATCNNTCSVGCNASVCNQADGSCACLDNFQQLRCDICDSGHYGTYCNVSCSHGCVNNTCNRTDGHCVKNIVTTSDPNTEDPAKDSLPLAVIGGGAGGGVAVIVVVIVIVVFCRRRKGRKNELNENELATVDGERNNVPVYATIQRKSSGSHDSYGKSVTVTIQTAVVNGNTVATQNSTTSPKENRDTGSKSDIDISMNEENLEIDADEAVARIRAIKFEEHGGVYYNSANEIQKGKIRVSELQKFVAKKDTDFFEEEFEKLPYGLIKKYDESQRTVNMSMNRYKGIYPYDDSRVKVVGGHTDYINASFIDGYKRRNAFIATLGPMSKQLGDFATFWRMIWQQKVDTIVMVTNLVEEGIDKCEQYWPNVESSTLYGDIRVSCINEDEYAEFIRRTFVINLKKEQRTMYHLHFTAWPDKGIPEDVTSIIELRQKVLNVPVVLGGPTVVHCSAGIGRTGTYIAIDNLIKEGEAEGMVDIPGCVVNMRQNRPNMVQTVEQYEYLHHALVHALTFDCNPVARDTFQKYMDGITDDMITRKFTQLQTTVYQCPSEEKEAETRNRNQNNKNRDEADIPGDDNRPRLHLNLKPGASDYINAVYINSFRKTKHWILAQTPLSGTVNDFLTLALQENCSCIISMTPDTEGNKTVGVYIAADNQVMKKGLFAVSGSDPVDNDYMTTRSMTISYRAAPGQPSKEHTIQHLQFTDWDMDRDVPRSPSNFLRLIKDVEAQASLHASGPVLIHCLTGAGRGGLLCVVAMLMEMMEVEREVSVVNAIRKVKARRRGAVPHQEQFAFCHECILEYISSFETYSNYVNNLRM